MHVHVKKSCRIAEKSTDSHYPCYVYFHPLSVIALDIRAYIMFIHVFCKSGIRVLNF